MKALTVTDQEYLKVHVTLDPEEYGAAGEYLWAVPAPDGDPTHVQIKNIPFFAAPILALDDVVEIGPAEASPECVHGGRVDCQWCRAPEVVKGLIESGQETGRLFFETHLSKEERLDIIEKMHAMGVKTEWADAHLLSFSFHMDRKVRPIVQEWVHDKKIATCDISDAGDTE